MAHHVALVGFLADAGGWPGGHKAVLFACPTRHHRPAVVDQPAVQDGLDRLVNFQVIPGRLAGLLDKGIDHPFVHRVAPGDHHPGEQHRIADLQAADGFDR